MQQFECNHQVSIYKLTSPANKVYIGSTCNLTKRLRLHKRDSKTKTHYLYRAVVKYGWENFKVTVIESCCPLVRNDRENHWIKVYDTLNPQKGYNLRLADNTEMAEETKEKMRRNWRPREYSDKNKEATSNRMKGNNYAKGRVPTEESKKKQSERMKGKNHPNFGKSPSEESKQKSREAHLGKHPTMETRQKQSIAHLGNKNSLGCKQSEETKKKKADAIRGEKNVWFGIPVPEDRKQKQIASLNATLGRKKQEKLLLARSKLKVPYLFGPPIKEVI